MREIVGGVVRYHDLVAKIKIMKVFSLACLLVIRENLCSRKFLAMQYVFNYHTASFYSRNNIWQHNRVTTVIQQNIKSSKFMEELLVSGIVYWNAGFCVLSLMLH